MNQLLRLWKLSAVVAVLLGILFALLPGANRNTIVNAAPPAQGGPTPRAYLPLMVQGSQPPVTNTPPSVSSTPTPTKTPTKAPTITPTVTRVPSLTAVPPPPVTPPPSAGDWAMLAANPQRTSWTAEEVRGDLRVDWYHPIEPYIPTKIQPIAANGNIYVSTARGLYAFRAVDGALLWVYATELPLGHSPTIAKINGKMVAYVGGYDHKIHAIDANTGQAVAGYTPFEADAGFETNPLVLDNATVSRTIFAGNRDGNFYALDAVTGALKWKYKTGGPVLFSAAYKNGMLYFASNDSYAYALTSDGSLVWKSAKLPGAGFQSYWSVIYSDPVTGKDYVIFTGAESYRQLDGALTDREPQYFFPGCRNLPPNTCPTGLLGSTSTANGDGYWKNGTTLIDAAKIADYFENYPGHRTVFILDRANGTEYHFDSDGDGKTESAPMTWAGVTQSGNKYPPLVNGNDNIFYQATVYFSGGGWIPRGDVVGWKFGTHQVSRVANIAEGHAIDEPMAFASGGKVVYWSLCCDREAGAFDVTMPYGQANRGWTYFQYSLKNLAPGFDAMYNDGNTTLFNNTDGWQIYSGKNQSVNGVYGKHGTTQSPPIPYQGKVYMLKGNALIAFSPNASAPTKLALAAIVPAQSAVTPPTSAALKQRLETEIQKILDAGPLRPGQYSAGFYDLYSGYYADDRDFGEIFDYFQNPSDTIVTLLQALPHLSPAMQTQVKAYVQNNYGPGAAYDFTRIVHVGWNTGAAREAFDMPALAWSEKYSSFGKLTGPICGSCGYWKNYPPYSFYAAWKYARTFGNAKPIFDSIKAKVEAPLSDTTFTVKPYLLNLYLAGYGGYLELQSLAGYSKDATVQGWYNHLLDLRVNHMNKDASSSNPFPFLINYYRSMSLARNFMFLTPEIAQAMNAGAKAQVQTAINEYNYVGPYWFVSNFDATTGEGTRQQLYDSPALFQAKAYILKEPFNNLVKWLDVPAFARGDLFYIQNVVAALAAAP